MEQLQLQWGSNSTSIIEPGLTVVFTLFMCRGFIILFIVDMDLSFNDVLKALLSSFGFFWWLDCYCKMSYYFQLY